MYQVFAGQLPFDAESFMGVMTKHMYEPPPLPSQLSADLRGSVEDIIMRALQKKPEQRYASMLLLREDLERAQSGQTPRASQELGVAGHDHASRPPAAASQPVISEPSFVAKAQSSSLPADTGPSLTLAALTSAVGDDDPVAVPMRRKPIWVLLLIGLFVVGIGALSFGLWGGAEPTGAGQNQRAASSAAKPPSAAAGAAAPGIVGAAGTGIEHALPRIDHVPPRVEHAPPRIEAPVNAEKRPRAKAPKPARRKPKIDHEKVLDPWQ
jgi:serine/threonine-protein kinase